MMDSYDCLVLGNGSAAAASAALLAEGGRSTLLLSCGKESPLREFDSLMPETYWVLRRLGLLEAMRRGRFVSKQSVRFISSCGRDSQGFFFPDHDPRECARTWQVERSEFGQLLRQNAEAKGVTCLEEARVREVRCDGDRPYGVVLQTAEGEHREIRFRVLLDGSGKQSPLLRALEIPVEERPLRRVAVWGCYEGAELEAGEFAGGTVILHTRSRKSWFWFVPLAGGVTSIGVVGPREYLFQRNGTPAQVFEEELVRCPALTERLLNARLAGPFQVARETEWLARRTAGQGWALVGDAFGAVDPIFFASTFLAMRSAELAADAILAGFERNDLSAAQLGGWMPEFRAGVERLRRCGPVFNSESFHLGDFLRDFPEHPRGWY